MHFSSLAILEFDKIRLMLANRASSAMGREVALQLEPVNDRAEVTTRLQETQEAWDILAAAATVPLGGFHDIRTLLRRTELGASLEPHELLAVGGLLHASRRVKNFFNDYSQTKPTLIKLVTNIVILGDIENIIEATVTEQGNVRDDASAELLRLRRDIKNNQARIRDKLDQILHSHEYQKFFQDTLVTIRGDRYVIPVKQEYRHNFPGIIHDQSSSGATVFIEPLAVVNLNNELKQLMAAENNEIERILQLVSSQIAKFAANIHINCNILAQLDFAFAKARLAIDMKAGKSILNDNGYIQLNQARHPLIASDIVVPIDIHIGRDFHTLLITGPNTGGKTVALKTVGLFALMNQAGLFVPAAMAEMPVFKNVFADIGDEQSIEHSLSTFSAHMTNLVNILHKVCAKDLVLIDEIGIGTDPNEGSALAMAVLEFLHNAGVRTIATTHYSELKTFAYMRTGIENASVEFDINTLKPTYRLLVGIPGSSNAFAISKRLGLNEQIILRAKQLMNKEHAELESILSALQEQKLSYFKRSNELQQLRVELEEIRHKLLAEKEQLKLQKKEIIAKSQNQAVLILRQAKREAEAVISELKAQFTVQNEQARLAVIHSARSRLQDNLNALDLEEADNDDLPGIPPEKIKPGMNIWVTKVKQAGAVLSVGENEVLVQLGILKMNVPIADCRLLPDKNKDKSIMKMHNAYNDSGLAKAQAVTRQIDIRGLTVEEAEARLDKYLDDALLAGLKEVVVIHGKGTGALRKGIRLYLNNHPHIAEIRIAESNEGGDGATVVKLK